MLTELKLELEKLAAQGRVKEFHPVRGRDGVSINIRDKNVIDFSNWDFLCVRKNKNAIRVMCQHAEVGLVGSGSSRACSGTFDAHLRCEERLAKFFGTQSALLFSSKNQAVLSLITSLISEHDLIIYDEAIQSPVADAAYLVGATSVGFPLSDLNTLKSELEKAGALRRKFIFVESLSPITGELIDISRYSAIAARYGAELIVDESYAVGAIGLRGAGSSEADKGKLVANEVLVRYCDLSLGLGGFGCAICGPSILIAALVNRSRTFSVEASLPMAISALIEANVDYVEVNTATRERMNIFAGRLKNRLHELGKVASKGAYSPIICIPFEKLSLANGFSEGLFSRGFFVEALPIRTHLSERAIVRIIVNAGHAENNMDDLIVACSDILSLVEKKSA